MTIALVHSAPRWRVVVEEQARFLALKTRFVGAVVAAIIVIVGSTAISSAMEIAEFNRHALGAGSLDHGIFSALRSSFLLALAVAYPIAMWIGEDTGHRDYHWMMPVTRRSHALARVLAGWVWAMAGTTCWILSMMLIEVISAEITGFSIPDFHRVWWAWLAPFTSVTVLYLLTSAVAVGTRWPVAWIAAIVGGYAGLLGELRSLRFEAMYDRVFYMMKAPYGFAAGALGDVDIYDAKGHPTASAEHWLGASALWGVTGLALLVLASRHRDR